MKKIHTRTKRKFSVSTHKAGIDRERHRKKRPKTLKTEAAAHKWAEAHGFAKGKYELIKAKKGKRFQVKAI